MADILAPKASPQRLGTLLGIRRVNDVPMYVIYGAAVVIVVIIMLVAFHRSQHPEGDSASKKAVGTTERLAQDIVGVQTAGFIAAEEPTVMSPAVLVTPPVEEKSMPLATSPAQDVDPQSAPHDPQQDDEERIRQAKLQRFEQAVTNKTAVPIDLNREANASPATHNAPQTQARSQDATTVYQARLASLKAQDKPQSPAFGLKSHDTTSPHDLQSFDNKQPTDRWTLDSPLTGPRSPYELRAGSLLPATMISGINSDLPGQVIAQISQNVYDTATGKHRLLPQGTRLIGSYANEVAYGQERLFIAWQRLVFPDGKAMDIGAMPGTDAAGYAGFTDQVNHHYWRIFGSAFLMSGITAGLSMSQGGQNGQGNTHNKKRINEVLTEALGQQLGTVIAQMVAKNLNIAPTLEIRPGYRFNVMVIKDMTFTKPYQPFDYQQGEQR